MRSAIFVLPFFLSVVAEIWAQPLPIFPNENAAKTILSESVTHEITVEQQRQLSGGHLQGIQLQGDKLFVSGSSDQLAYLVIF